MYVGDNLTNMLAVDFPTKAPRRMVDFAISHDLHKIVKVTATFFIMPYHITSFSSGGNDRSFVSTGPMWSCAD